MKQTDVFSSKAEKYAKYRWAYAAEAIQAIMEITGMTQESILADIGAGTGILTKEFVGKVKRIYAIEPNPEMRAILKDELGKYPSCSISGKRAEATGLKSQSVDVITAAQAVHWFDPHKARAEFYRILKPGGWIVICRNYGNNPALGEALQNVYPAETDTETLMIGKSEPRSFYYGDGEYIQKAYPNRNQVDWEGFFGGLATASFAPDENCPMHGEFEQNARRVFDQFSIDNMIDIKSVTEVYIGQIKCR
jgi:ubiquinone/menaquinone biosynthesis C-methylase UbiE